MVFNLTAQHFEESSRTTAGTQRLASVNRREGSLTGWGWTAERRVISSGDGGPAAAALMLKSKA